jgi:hypothetical protein
MPITAASMDPLDLLYGPTGRKWALPEAMPAHEFLQVGWRVVIFDHGFPSVVASDDSDRGVASRPEIVEQYLAGWK